MFRQPEPQLDRRAFLGGTGALALGAPVLLDGGRDKGGDHAVRAWLEGYRRAWVRRDPDAVIQLFTPDAVYQEQPFQPAYEGARRSAATGPRSPRPSPTSSCGTARRWWTGTGRPSSGG